MAPIVEALRALAARRCRAPPTGTEGAMLFNLLAPLADESAAFNLFRYLTFRSGCAVMTALAISFIMGPRTIRWLKKKQREGQPIRQDGPESHLITKQGTPTMGGVLILAALALSTLLWADLRNPYVWVVLFVTVGFGLIGFFDDFLKLTRRSSRGLPSRTKFLAQLLVGLLASVTIAYVTRSEIATSVALPFVKNLLIPLTVWGFVPWSVFVMTAWSNAVNLTDGLDGLAIVPTMFAAGCFLPVLGLTRLLNVPAR